MPLLSGTHHFKNMIILEEVTRNEKQTADLLSKRVLQQRNLWQAVEVVLYSTVQPTNSPRDGPSDETLQGMPSLPSAGKKVGEQ